jgi:hypothetical protein
VPVDDPGWVARLDESRSRSVNDLLRFADANLSPPKDKLGEAIELAWTSDRAQAIASYFSAV